MSKELAMLRAQVKRLRKGRTNDRKLITALQREVGRVRRTQTDNHYRLNILSARIETLSRSGTAIQRMQRESERVALAKENRLRLENEANIKRLEADIRNVLSLADQEFRRLEKLLLGKKNQKRNGPGYAQRRRKKLDS